MNQSDHIVRIEHQDGSTTEVLDWGREWLLPQQVEEPKQTTLQKLMALLRGE